MEIKVPTPKPAIINDILPYPFYYYAHLVDMNYYNDRELIEARWTADYKPKVEALPTLELFRLCLQVAQGDDYGGEQSPICSLLHGLTVDEMERRIEINNMEY